VIVLDTHAWLYLVGDRDRLSAAATAAIDAASQLVISSISVWEAGLLAARGRVKFAIPTPAMTHMALHADDRIKEVWFDSEIALRGIAIMERGLTGDPADQMILATTESLGAKLVTADRRIRKFAPDDTIW
jgi:PIN domain nuclease of toxin-antitoxin system